MNLNADFIFSDTMLWTDSKLPEEVSHADVFLSSGQLSKILSTLTDHPIITIEPSIYDILSAYSSAISFDQNPVIIFPLKHALPLIDGIRNILPIELITNWYDEVDSIDLMLKTYKSRGCKCIIGSGLVCEKATALGMKSIFLYPRESLRSFIKIAYDMGMSMCEKAAENQRMFSVISNSQNGIIFTDESGNISICNPIAQKIFSFKASSIINTNIFNLIDDVKIHNTYDKKEFLKHFICTINSDKYIIYAKPIVQNNNLCNVMITINDIKSIQNQEYHIRTSLAERGFVARNYFEDYHSKSTKFNQLLSTAKKFALSDDNIIILGETGTGKEVLAQSIHNYTLRAKKPFVAVNCSALSETLLESELFGYDEGAFTGAKRGGKQGLFEMAHTGTIFLDEISELSLSLQTKLLRVIQEMQVIHVGGTHVINLDIRIIAATNKDLWSLVRSGKFREDLYYRLNVLELNLPPLRERPEDIYPLFIHFISKSNPNIQNQLEQISQKLSSVLCSYSWPGNIRELENFSKMIMVICNMAGSPNDIYNQINYEILEKCKKYSISFDQSKAVSGINSLDKINSSIVADYKKYSIEKDNELIHNALVESGGNITKAAISLGISRVTLWRKLKQLKQDTDM